MSRRHLISWLFTLSLLLGQASAFAHAIGHLHKSEGAVPDRVCEVCVAQANLGSAAPPAPLCLPGAGAVQLALSPWLGRQCRYLPTCSEYGKEAIEKHGALKGSWLAAKRIGRCRPCINFHEQHGFDRHEFGMAGRWGR